jgi:regulator of sirC expression with transglutaminase-like and TPR domain
MSLIESLKSLLSGSGGPASLHKRGMAKAKRENWDGAIADYSAVIDSSKASDELKAMARFNRALAYSQQGALSAAQADLKAVLAMTDAPANIVTASREKLARWEKRRGMQE